MEAKAHSRIGDAHIRGLSGGERRRVSAAVELMILRECGGVVILDEPMSGLDAVSARLLLAALQAAAARGDATVLLSVHQPTHAFMNAMDGVVVMASRGRQLYCGRAKTEAGGCALSACFDGDGFQLSHYSANPAEALLEALAGPEAAAQRRFEELASARVVLGSGGSGCNELGHFDGLGAHASCPDHVPTPHPMSRCAGFCAQFRQLAHRQLMLVYRHPHLVSINLALTVATSLLVGGAFWQLDRYDFDSVLSRVGLVFFLALFFIFTGLVSLNMWQADRLLYFAEHGAGAYGPAAYLLSKTLIDLLAMRVLPSLLCAAIVYPMVGLRSEDAEGPLAAGYFTIALVGGNVICALAFNCIGIAAPTSGHANLLAAFFSLFNLLLCGFLVNKHALEQMGEFMPGQLPYLSYLFPAFELVLSNELLGTTILLSPLEMEVEPVPVPGVEIMAQFGYHTGKCTRLLAGGTEGGCASTLYLLFGWATVLLTASYALLRWCVRDSH